MPVVVLSNGRKVRVAGPVKRAFDAAGLAPAFSAASVVGEEGEPGLALVIGEELVLVEPGGTARWRFSEIERVEEDDILTSSGAPVPIARWCEEGEAEYFRATVCDRIGQRQARAAAEAAPSSSEVSTDTLVTVLVGSFNVIGATWLVLWLTDASLLDILSLTDAAVLAIATTCLLGVPLVAAGCMLAPRPTAWRWLGVAAIVAGIAATIVLLMIFSFILSGDNLFTGENSSALTAV